MSSLYDVKVTLTIDGVEQDVFVRGFVAYEPGWGAELDGDILVRIGGDWWPLDSVNVDAGDPAYAERQLCEAALEDDSSQCREYEAAE